MCLINVIELLLSHIIIIIQLENTPLFVTSREGHFEIVEVLIGAGADVNFYNNVSA